MNVSVGSELVNPVTGERGVVRVAPTAENGRTLVAELFIQPGGAVAGEHVHPALEEAFTVLRGRVGLRLDGHEFIAPLNERIVVPRGMVHDWWNAGSDEAHVQVEVRPGDRFLEMVANLFGLARDGKTNPKGMPNLLQLVLFAEAFEDVVVFSRTPRWVLRLSYMLLAPFARLLGYQDSYPRYLEPLSSSRKYPMAEKLSVEGELLEPRPLERM